VLRHQLNKLVENGYIIGFKLEKIDDTGEVVNDFLTGCCWEEKLTISFSPGDILSIVGKITSLTYSPY
jgi:hypothetical protein